MPSRPSRTNACCRPFAARERVNHPVTSRTRAPQVLRNGQRVPDKSNGLLGELPCLTLWCSSLWDWRCSGSASSSLLFPRDGRRSAARARSETPVSRTRCGILHAAPQSRDRTKHRRSLRPRLWSAPRREERRTALPSGARKPHCKRQIYRKTLDSSALSAERPFWKRYGPLMDLITTTAELAAVCDRLSRHPIITVDTEFLRETTYYPLLCVVQMASAEEAVVIDTLAPGINLKPFFDLMTNEAVLKVFHAARQDIEIMVHRAGVIPHPIFDTQVAAMVLGYGDSIAYDQLVERIAGHRPDKTHRFTDWSRRPLSEEQMHYAVSDVTHLRDVFAALDVDLKKRGRSDWVSEEMEVLTSPRTYDFHPERAWERLKTRVRKPKELAVLMEVAAWREQEAQSRDVPRSRVLKDDAVGDIATHAPTSLERLAGLRSDRKSVV